MLKKALISLLGFLMSVTAQDLETSEADNFISNIGINPLEITEYIDPLASLNPLEEDADNVPKDFLISWQARGSLRKILAQMPCGWPEYGIPPLAPYENENFSFKLDNSVLQTETTFKPLRIDGLNNMVINRLKVGVLFKRVNFDFNFLNITFTGNFDTSTTLNLEDVMALKFFAKGSGKFKLSLQNLRIKGNLKYKLPIFVGSAKITNINAQVSLGNVSSELSGSMNGVPIGEKVNDFVITQLLKYLNDHDYLWNGLIEKHVLPFVNAQLEGQTLWKIFWWSISRSENTCAPGELTDLDIMELHQLLLKQAKPLLK